MFDSRDARRRWWGVFFLTMSATLLMWGETFLKSILIESKLLFIFYWFLCLVFITLAIVTAVLDMNATRKRFRVQQRALIEQTLVDLKKDVDE